MCPYWPPGNGITGYQRYQNRHLHQQCIQNDVTHEIPVDGLRPVYFETILHALHHEVQVAGAIGLKGELKNEHDRRNGRKSDIGTRTAGDFYITRSATGSTCCPWLVSDKKYSSSECRGLMETTPAPEAAGRLTSSGTGLVHIDTDLHSVGYRPGNGYSLWIRAIASVLSSVSMVTTVFDGLSSSCT